jgi:3-hydroxy-3-methylglutaryl CoA synthase
MAKHKYYSGAKGEFVQDRMKDGRTNKQAHSDWKKSEERKEYTERNDYAGYTGNGDNIDRSYNSLMQDWAETSDDL